MRITSKLKDYHCNFFKEISEVITSLKEDKDIVWIIDENVYNLYPELPRNKFGNGERVLEVVSDEKLKSFKHIDSLFCTFELMGVKSTTTVIAIGGGTLQDAVGFACSVYHRGIKWKFVPTTLLSQADSCIGGKTSINFNNTKNVIGTFYPPDEILVCSKFFNTLPVKQYKSGIGEIIKFHILCGADFDANKPIEDLVKWSLYYKSYIVEEDEFDEDKRKLLNYGHTFGHALESTSNYKIPHGTAILIGILIANNYANKVDILDPHTMLNITNQIIPYLNHINYKEEWFDYDKLISLTKKDKKFTDNLNMILLNGKSAHLASVTDFDNLRLSIFEIQSELCK